MLSAMMKFARDLRGPRLLARTKIRREALLAHMCAHSALGALMKRLFATKILHQDTLLLEHRYSFREVPYSYLLPGSPRWR